MDMLLIERQVLQIKICFCNIWGLVDGCVRCSFLYGFGVWHVGQVVDRFGHFITNKGKDYIRQVASLVSCRL